MVKFWVRHGCTYQLFSEMAKALFVEAAEQELKRTGRNITVSSISVITGIRREEVKRVKTLEPSNVSTGVNTVARVIGQWREDSRFSTKAGKPRLLTCHTEDSEFSQLVKTVNKHIHPATVLAELKRLNAVSETKRGIRLIRQLFSYEIDVERGFEMLSRDIDSLIHAGEENLLNRQKVSNLHLRTEYDNVVATALPEIRTWLLQEGKDLHRRAREYVSQYDKDVNPELPDEAESAYVILGTFSLTPELKNEESKQDKAAGEG